MVNISELKEDFKSYMTVEEVLEKHGITFGEAVRLCSKNQPRRTKKRRTYEKTDEKYISKYCNKYVIRRKVNGKVRWFGSYATIEDAIKVRDYLEEHGWYYNRVKGIRKKLGV